MPVILDDGRDFQKLQLEWVNLGNSPLILNCLTKFCKSKLQRFRFCLKEYWDEQGTDGLWAAPMQVHVPYSIHMSDQIISFIPTFRSPNCVSYLASRKMGSSRCELIHHWVDSVFWKVLLSSQTIHWPKLFWHHSNTYPTLLLLVYHNLALLIHLFKT